MPWNSSDASCSETSLDTEDTFLLEDKESDLCSAETEAGQSAVGETLNQDLQGGWGGGEGRGRGEP